MKLSVVLTSYNYARFLPQAIEAILAQSLQPDEFIILDDASIDESIEIIRDYARDNTIINPIKNDRNLGIVSCLNLGLELAKGHYIVYAAADDMILPGFFEKSVKLLDEYPRAAFSSAQAKVIDEKGRMRGRWPSPVLAEKGYITPQAAIQFMRRHGFWLVGNTVVFCRQALVEEGGFSQNLGPLSDSFICQVMALRYGACYIPEKLACLRQTENSYQSLTLSNTERSLEIARHAYQLMTTTYKDLFPPDYAERCKSIWLYNVGVFAGKSLLLHHDNHLDSLRQALSPLNWFDQFFLFVLGTLARIKLMLAQLYLYTRLRRLTNEQVRRWFIYGIQNVWYRIKKQRSK